MVVGSWHSKYSRLPINPWPISARIYQRIHHWSTKRISLSFNLQQSSEEFHHEWTIYKTLTHDSMIPIMASRFSVTEELSCLLRMVGVGILKYKLPIQKKCLNTLCKTLIPHSSQPNKCNGTSLSCRTHKSNRNPAPNL